MQKRNDLEIVVMIELKDNLKKDFGLMDYNLYFQQSILFNETYRIMAAFEIGLPFSNDLSRDFGGLIITLAFLPIIRA